MATWLNFREPVSAWTHGLWLLLSPLALVILWRAGRGDRVKRAGFLVFGLSLALCYAGSTAFHGVRLSPDAIEFFATLDSIGIYLLIAGTVTPVALVVLRDRWQWGILVSAWALAGVGILLALTPLQVPRAISTGLYLGLGWGVALCYFVLAQTLSHRALRPLLTGGVLYTVGAVLNLLRWPLLWPGVFSAHELFHLFVMGGSLAHVWFMLRVIGPYDRRNAAPIPVTAQRRTRPFPTPASA